MHFCFRWIDENRHFWKTILFLRCRKSRLTSLVTARDQIEEGSIWSIFWEVNSSKKLPEGVNGRTHKTIFEKTVTLTAEVSQKWKLAFLRWVGAQKKINTHAGWECEFRFLQHLRTEDAISLRRYKCRRRTPSIVVVVSSQLTFIGVWKKCIFKGGSSSAYAKMKMWTPR